MTVALVQPIVHTTPPSGAWLSDGLRAATGDEAKYRYTLWRRWSNVVPYSVFIMLNPSTADARENDATIRKLLGFAHRWDSGGVYVANMYAWRATEPDELLALPEATRVGPYNDLVLAGTLRYARDYGAKVVCAWGNGPGHKYIAERARSVRATLKASGVPVFAFGFTKDGHPYHPLYQPYDKELTRWEL